MKSHVFTACLVASVWAVVLFQAGCKSKETRSCILHYQNGNYDLAIETGRQGLEIDPSDADAHFCLGLSYSALDSLRLAYEHYTRARELDSGKASLVEGNIQGNFAEHYNRGQSVRNSRTAQISQTSALSLLGEAAGEFAKATEADPRRALGFYWLGIVYVEMGELAGTREAGFYPLAAENLDQALELLSPEDDHYRDAVYYLALGLARAGQHDKAISSLKKGIAHEPSMYEEAETIGNECLELGDYAGAVPFLELAAQTRERVGAEDFDLYYNLGVASFKSREGDPAALTTAVDYWQKALSLRPDEPTTVWNITTCYLAAENWREAAIWGEKHVALKPESVDGWRYLAMAYTELGDKDRALSCSKQYENFARARRDAAEENSPGTD